MATADATVADTASTTSKAPPSLEASASATSSSSSSSLIIVEAPFTSTSISTVPSTSVNATNNAAASGSLSSATDSCQQQQQQKPQQQQQQYHHATDSGARAVVCTCTSELLAFYNAYGTRCHHPLPSKAVPKVNASAQTTVSFLPSFSATTPLDMSRDTGSSHGTSQASLDTDHLGAIASVYANKSYLTNYIPMVSTPEGGEVTPVSSCSTSASSCSTSASASNSVSVSKSACATDSQQGKRKHNQSCQLDAADCGGTGAGHGSSVGGDGEMNSRKRVANHHTSSPRSSPSGILAVPSTSDGVTGSPLGRHTPRSLSPPPEQQHWISQYLSWSKAERLLAMDLFIENTELTLLRHMMKVTEPQIQRDFISMLPDELSLHVLSYLDPKDLGRASQTCHSWRLLCDDDLLWKKKCRKAQISTEFRTDRPRRGRSGNMPPSASPWKAAYIRQHTIEMNWRSRPIRELKMLKGNDNHKITCLHFAGNSIVSGSNDETLKVWSVATGRCMRTLLGHMSAVYCVHLHGSKVVSGSNDATLRVWNIELGTCLHVLVGHLAGVFCVQYDGNLIVSGSHDNMVKIWNPERQECLHTLLGHTNRVYSLQFNGLHVASISLDRSIRVWDVETGNCRHTLMGHLSRVSSIELRQNILVVVNTDVTIKFWDITNGQCLQTVSGGYKHQSPVTCLQFNSRFIIISFLDGTVKLWDIKTGEFIRNLVPLQSDGSGGVVRHIRANDTKMVCVLGSRNSRGGTKLMVLDFDV